MSLRHAVLGYLSSPISLDFSAQGGDGGSVRHCSSGHGDGSSLESRLPFALSPSFLVVGSLPSAWFSSLAEGASLVSLIRNGSDFYKRLCELNCVLWQ